jgi:hypothetical protein
LGTPFFTLALTMKVIRNRPQNYTAEWQTKCFFHTKFEVDPIKNTRKIRLLSALCFGPILTLTFDLYPHHMV